MPNMVKLRVFKLLLWNCLFGVFVFLNRSRLLKVLFFSFALECSNGGGIITPKSGPPEHFAMNRFNRNLDIYFQFLSELWKQLEMIGSSFFFGRPSCRFSYRTRLIAHVTHSAVRWFASIEYACHYFHLISNHLSKHRSIASHLSFRFIHFFLLPFGNVLIFKTTLNGLPAWKRRACSSCPSTNLHISTSSSSYMRLDMCEVFVFIFCLFLFILYSFVFVFVVFFFIFVHLIQFISLHLIVYSILSRWIEKKKGVR